MSVVKKGVTYASAGSSVVVDCIFCRITRRDPLEPATVVAENSKFVAFKNIYPTTSNHLLISPKHHISNVAALSASDTAIVEEMHEFAKLSLESDSEGAFYCFHIPPFNSIDHLHLHAIAKPSEMSFVNGLKYSTRTPWCSTPEQLIESLRRKAL